MRLLHGGMVVLALGLAALISGCTSTAPQGSSSIMVDTNLPPSLLVQTNYHGWEDALLMSNGKVEAIIVPQIGRVMQFRFAGEEDGPFWENEQHLGKAASVHVDEWSDFGGDRAWPAPRRDWGGITSRSWPPPSGFDAMPATAEVDGWNLRLVSSVDPDYGIRTVREIVLTPGKPEMRIRTTFEKVSEEPNLVGVWVVTQLKEPVGIGAPVAAFSVFPDGYRVLDGEAPPSLANVGGILWMTRNPKMEHRIGMDACTLLWVGQEQVLRIDSARVLYGRYPDQGSSAEVYTASNEQGRYVELEMLGPLKKMLPGDRIHRESFYTLTRRAEHDPAMEAKIILAKWRQ